MASAHLQVPQHSHLKVLKGMALVSVGSRTDLGYCKCTPCLKRVCTAAAVEVQQEYGRAAVAVPPAERGH